MSAEERDVTSPVPLGDGQAVCRQAKTTLLLHGAMLTMEGMGGFVELTFDGAKWPMRAGEKAEARDEDSSDSDAKRYRRAGHERGDESDVVLFLLN